MQKLKSHTHTHTHLLSLFPLHVKKAPSFILSSCNLTVTGTVALLSQLAGTPLSAHEPQGGNICIVCLHPAPGAHTHTHTLIYIYVLHLHIWIKYSLAVHLHCNMLTETTISCFL